jgi:hypothetical protein
LHLVTAAFHPLSKCQMIATYSAHPAEFHFASISTMVRLETKQTCHTPRVFRTEDKQRLPPYNVCLARLKGILVFPNILVDDMQEQCRPWHDRQDLVESNPHIHSSTEAISGKSWGHRLLVRHLTKKDCPKHSNNECLWRSTGWPTPCRSRSLRRARHYQHSNLVQAQSVVDASLDILTCCLNGLQRLGDE